MEKVIFRSYQDEFFGFTKYLAVFPQSPANIGRVEAIGFLFNPQGKAYFDPCDEVSMKWYYDSTKVVHKRDTEKLLSALNEYCDNEIDFEVAERMTAEDDKMRWGWITKRV